MERQAENPYVLKEQEARDVDRFINEGGRDIVSARELALRREIWKQMLGNPGERVK
ncbi:MAG: hypothetical protein ABI230_02775 [Aestuariivirga sp.]